MKRLGVLDTAFLIAERRETPMHVGGINLFTLPDGIDEQAFLHGLADNLRSARHLQHPFGDCLKTGRAGLLGPMFWEEDESLDIDYHIRHSALPKPGRYRELFALVSRLHGTLLDRDRPLWEMHLIEGLQNREFAVYSKFHHAAIDGVRSMHLTQSMYSADPNERIHDSPLSLESGERYRAMLKQHQQMLEADTQYTDSELRRVAESLKAQFDSGVHLLGALRRVVGAWAGKGDALKVPWLEVPHTSINTPVVDGARRFVAQSWPFARIRAVGKALDGTFNDAVLAMCAGALRRQLQNHGELPSKSLKAMVPVSLRRAGDVDSANAVGTISADLATNIKDPVKRFVAIQKSMAAGKDLFSQLAPREAALLTQLTVLPGLVLLPLGLLGRFPPFSTVISNVPGPRQPMYWNGAKLKGIYPASIVTDGVALNITLVSCHDQVDFGITACRRSMPQAQRFIDYLDESLVELEEAVGLAKSAEPTRRASSSSAKRKAPVSARSKASASGASKAVRKAKLKPRSAAAKKSTADAKAKAPAKAKAASKTKVAAKPKAKAQAKARTKARAPAAVAKTDG